jgi:catechol 2,3-dioxygenase-like lactoylglutathione lyase family enzyme
MLEKIHHLGYAVQSIEVASRFYEANFDVELSGPETVEGQGIVATMFRVGESAVELMEPTRPDSPVGKFLARLKSSGARLVDEEPKVGVGGTRTAFVHPKGAFGVLTELVELPDRAR